MQKNFLTNPCAVALVLKYLQVMPTATYQINYKTLGGIILTTWVTICCVGTHMDTWLHTNISWIIVHGTILTSSLKFKQYGELLQYTYHFKTVL